MKKVMTTGSIALALASVWAQESRAAGFALIEQSASGIGNAMAGAAASAEDASTIFFNPAGMTLLPGRQIVIGVHGVLPTSDFDNRGSVSPGIRPAGGDGGDPFGLGVIPNLYASWGVTDRVSVGLGVNVPFGLKTDYDEDWVGRFQAQLSEVKTLNINPAVAFKLTDRISIGAGINYQTAEATLTRALNLGVAEGQVRIEGNDHGSWGWNAGALFSLGDDMRVGVSYRSKIDHTLDGDVTFSPAVAPNGPVTAKVTLPDSISLSVFQRFNDKWDMMGDITWTGWSSFDKLEVRRANGALLQSTTENWDDSWRISLGLNYRFNEQWKLRTGVAYDQTPVSDRYRTARIPDNDRFWVALGAQWKPSAHIAVDLSYAHLFVKDASINDSQGTGLTGNGLLRGTYDGSVDILSAQVAFMF